MAVKSITINKTGLLLFAGALFVVAGATAARAAFDSGSPEAAQIMSRLGQLETQVQTLSRSVFRGDVPPPAMGGSSGDLSGYQDRLNQLEQQQRGLTGQLEQVSHQAQELQSRLDKMQADTEMRLQQLEQGRGAAPASSSAAGTAYAPPQALEAVPQPGGSQTLGTMPATGADYGSSDALYNSAFADVRDAKYESAEAKFHQFLTQYPSDSKAGNAQYWLSETHYVRGDYKQAAKMFAQGYQDYPQSPKAADSLLKLGLSLEKMGKKDDACLSFQQLRKQFPGDNVPANHRAAQEMKELGCK